MKRPFQYPGFFEKRTRVIQYFNAIGQRYDLADSLMSFGLHFFWRKTCLQYLDMKKDSCILDLCGGTGEFARHIARLKTRGRFVVCDFSPAMMAAGKKKAEKAAAGSGENKILWMQGDAEQLGFCDNCFDAVFVGFGIRNLVDMPGGFAEIYRVLKPGGKLIIMEFSTPETPWIKTLYNWYSFKIMPFLGKVITGEDAPFIYLAESVRRFPAPETIKTLLEASGFSRVGFNRLTDGIVIAYCGRKRGPTESENERLK